MNPTNQMPNLKLKFSTFIKPFTPDRPTHNYLDIKSLNLFIEMLDNQKFYSTREIAIKEFQGDSWVTIASRFNNIWYVAEGSFKG